jgi:putative tryptophan/tyrosine transport system substrate-binding protein
MIRRREFITLLGAAAWPVAARAQQPRMMPLIGYLDGNSPKGWEPYLEAFLQGLRERGFVERQNMTIEYRWLDNHFEQVPAVAADFVQRGVDVIVVSAGSAAVRVVKAATATIPIVFQSGADPVALGLVASLNRPGGNITGISNITVGLAAKRLDLLHQLKPSAASIGILINPTFPTFQAMKADLLAAARALKVDLVFVDVTSDIDFDPAFASLVGQHHVGAVFLVDNPIFNNRREQLVALAARYAIPTIYTFREFARAGGLISYASNLAESYRQTGIYTGRILKGEKPADLPVLLPTKFDLVINLRTAKALGLEIPPSLLAIADEVVE